MELAEKLKLLPDKPGVYLMKDPSGKVIYVGKAISLKNRVRSYFQSPAGMSPKVRAMVSHIADLDYILTDSEVEALILESSLIKENRPKYNIDLRDDKSYPFIKVTLDEEFPRVLMTRNLKKDGARYFGPYTSSGSVKETLKLLKQLFPFRSCQKKTVDRKHRPCLNAHIHQCLAPCSGNISQGEYIQMISSIVLFLEGRQTDLIRRLAGEMEQAAENLEFERAARLRDQVQALENVVEKQKIASVTGVDRDIIGVHRGEDETCAQVFFVRQGRVVGRQHFLLQEGAEDETDGDVLAAFLKQYYSLADYIPREIFLPADVHEAGTIGEWLTGRRGGKVRLKAPKRGDGRQLVELVVKNARRVVEERRAARDENRQEGLEALEELKHALGLTGTPYRIECYDISNTGGAESVGSMVVFEGGRPYKPAYRKFKIKGVAGPDDFASMAEVIGRRFRRGLEERERLDALDEGWGRFPVEAVHDNARFASFPDLVIVDGGKGQLGAAREAMRELGVADIPAYGLAKEFEHLFTENLPDPIILPRRSKALRLLQQIRDEAHRFAITYHRNLRGKASLTSVLDGVSGLGPKRKALLLKHFGSVRRLREASLDEVAAVPGFSRRLAEVVLGQLKGGAPEGVGEKLGRGIGDKSREGNRLGSED